MRLDLRRMSLRDLAQLLKDIAREVESRERRHVGGRPGGPHGGGHPQTGGGSYYGQQFPSGGGRFSHQQGGGGAGGGGGGFQRGGFRRRHQGQGGYTPREAPLPEPREPQGPSDTPQDSAGNRDGANEGRFGG